MFILVDTLQSALAQVKSMQNLSHGSKKSQESQLITSLDAAYSFHIAICTQFLRYMSRANHSICIRVVDRALGPCIWATWCRSL